MTNKLKGKDNKKGRGIWNNSLSLSLIQDSELNLVGFKKRKQRKTERERETYIVEIEFCSARKREGRKRRGRTGLLVLLHWICLNIIV